MKLGTLAALVCSVVVALTIIVFVASEYAGVSQYLADLDQLTSTQP